MIGNYSRKCHLKFSLDFPGGWHSKTSACGVGDPGSIPGLGGSSGEGNGNPLQYSCLKNPLDRGILVGYSPWGCKESDMTERLLFHLNFYTTMINTLLAI